MVEEEVEKKLNMRRRRLFAERRSDGGTGNTTTSPGTPPPPPPPPKQQQEHQGETPTPMTNFLEMLDRFRYTPPPPPPKCEFVGLKKRKTSQDPQSHQQTTNPNPNPNPNPSPVGVVPQTPTSTTSKEKDPSRSRSRSRSRSVVNVRVVSPYFPLPKSVQPGEVIVVAKKKPNKKPKTSNPNKDKKDNNKKKIIRSRPLTAAEKVNEAYRRKSPDNTWIPPPSPHSLIQESHYHDPWKVLIICILLNRTTGQQLKSGGITSKLFTLCPDAKTAVGVPTEHIEKVIKRLGLYKKRAQTIHHFSLDYLDHRWTHVTQLHGIGKYAADAYAIFCTGQWDKIKPEDHMLDKYWEYLCWMRQRSRSGSGSPYPYQGSIKGRGTQASDDADADGEISHTVAGGTE